MNSYVKCVCDIVLMLFIDVIYNQYMKNKCKNGHLGYDVTITYLGRVYCLPNSNGCQPGRFIVSPQLLSVHCTHSTGWNRQGADSIWRCHLTSIWKSHCGDKTVIRMGIPILVRWHLYIESGPWLQRERSWWLGPIYSFFNCLCFLS